MKTISSGRGSSSGSSVSAAAVSSIGGSVDSSGGSVASAASSVGASVSAGASVGASVSTVASVVSSGSVVSAVSMVSRVSGAASGPSSAQAGTRGRHRLKARISASIRFIRPHLPQRYRLPLRSLLPQPSAVSPSASQRSRTAAPPPKPESVFAAWHLPPVFLLFDYYNRKNREMQ